MGNGNGLPISHVGSSVLHSSSQSFRLNNSLCVPNITKNLLSVRQLTKDNNVIFEFHPSCCFLKDQATNHILLRGIIRDGLYVLHHLDTTSPRALIGERTSANIWHARLGHPSNKVLAIVSTNYHLPFTSSSSSFCDACQCNKSKRLPFYSSFSRCTRPLELIHSDLWGPAPITATGGYRYYIHFTDHFSRFMWVFPLFKKSDAMAVFVSFKLHVEKLLGFQITQLHSDGGGEFKKFKHFLALNSITHRFSCPHTHAQNGLAERKHRHVVETGLTLLARSSLPSHYWDHAFTTSAHLINRMPTSVLSNLSPYEILFNRPLDYSFLGVFGCACFPNLHPYNKNKLQPRSV